MPYLLIWDTRLTSYISGIIPHSPFFDAFFSFLSLKGGFAVWGIILILLLILYEERHNHVFLFHILLGCGTTYLFVDKMLKNIFMRPRPVFPDFNRFQLISTSFCPKDFSFPSTHAATAFAAAAMLSYFDRKRAAFYYFMAFLISYSRIYLECHYLLDVVFGGLTGYLIVKIILFAKLSYRKRETSVQKR